jgi:hypothetical protein
MAGVQAAIQEGLSMLFMGPISDWIGLLEGIAFNGDIERVGHSIHDNFDIPGDTGGKEKA